MEYEIDKHWLSPQFYGDTTYVKQQLDDLYQDDLDDIVDQQYSLRTAREQFIKKVDAIICDENPFNWHEDEDEDECLAQDISFYIKLIYYSVYAGNTYLLYRWGIEHAIESSNDIDFHEIKESVQEWLEAPKEINLEEIHKPYINYLYNQLMSSF